MEWLNVIRSNAWAFVSRRWFAISGVSGAGYVAEKATALTAGPWLEIGALLVGAGGLAVKVIDTYWKWKDRKARKTR